MIGRVGWTTATARTSGNVSSACRYKTGASSRASVAPVSVWESMPGADDGSDGRWRRGPHATPAAHTALDKTRNTTAARRRVTKLEAPSRPSPRGLSGWLVVHSWRSLMRKPRPATYNPAQALQLISHDRTGSPLSCPSCSGQIVRDPQQVPPPPRSHVTLRCAKCGRVAKYIAGAA